MVYFYCLVMLEGINGDLCRNGEKDDDEIASDKTAGNETAATNRPIPTSKLVTSSENVLHHGCLGIGYVKQEKLYASFQLYCFLLFVLFYFASNQLQLGRQVSLPLAPDLTFSH